MEIGQADHSGGTYRGPLEMVGEFVTRLVIAGEPTVFLYGTSNGRTVSVRGKPHLMVQRVVDPSQQARAIQLVSDKLSVDSSQVVWVRQF